MFLTNKVFKRHLYTTIAIIIQKTKWKVHERSTRILKVNFVGNQNLRTCLPITYTGWNTA